MFPLTNESVSVCVCLLSSRPLRMCPVLRSCWTRLNLWAALRKSSSVTPPSVCCARVCSSQRARANYRTSSASYTSSTAKRKTRRRATGGRASTSRQPHTAVCVSTRCLKEIRGERNLTGWGMDVIRGKFTCFVVLCCLVQLRVWRNAGCWRIFWFVPSLCSWKSVRISSVWRYTVSLTCIQVNTHTHTMC